MVAVRHWRTRVRTNAVVKMQKTSAPLWKIVPKKGILTKVLREANVNRAASNDEHANADDDYRHNYLEALRSELVNIVQDKLSPLALKYGYTQVPLESNIKWKPIVLLIGNYSSGKSTLINELIGTDIQMTGQAPTDDSFTVITAHPNASPPQDVVIRDGQVLLNDPQYPFEGLRRFGKRFAAHFRLKLLKTEMLHNLALIDTPGMLDSVAEKDRGYDYQEVLGDLAQIADRILIIFDPHKAGTIREVYQSLRETLPRKSFEDRVMFVLNRIDECSSIDDLLRVYGTLCWNLSQMTGRKDIPPIHLTWSDNIYRARQANSHNFMQLLHNQRSTLREGIFSAPRHRLDNLAGYIELHSERIAMLLSALLAAARQRRQVVYKSVAVGLLPTLLVTALCYWLLQNMITDYLTLGVILAAVALCSGGGAFWFIRGWLAKRFHRKLSQQPDTLVTLTEQASHDCWEAVRETVKQLLQQAPPSSSGQLRRELKQIRSVRDYSAAEVRQAIATYENIHR